MPIGIREGEDHEVERKRGIVGQVDREDIAALHREFVHASRHAATRRQLMEYAIAYDVDGVLLVDMESEKVRRVAFPELHQPGSVGMMRWAALIALLVLGLGIGVATQPLLVSWWQLATG